MAELSQIQISFSEIEDRFLLRISTTDNEEFRFWLTRRFTSHLFPLMLETIQAIPDVASQKNNTNRDAVMDFQREQATQGADFSTPFSVDSQEIVYPLGENAVLVVRGTLLQKSENLFNLSLKNSNDMGIDFSFNTDILYLLHKLLQDSLQRTNWGLSFASPNVATIAANPARTLN
jgi:hypothetical protein